MPQSAVRSYFKEQSSAKWELQIPEAVAKESHRWPIGFVTTGFVRGRLVFFRYIQTMTVYFYLFSILLSFL